MRKNSLRPNQMKRGLFLVGLCFATAFVASTRAQVVKPEMTVFGLPLGEKLTLPECPRERAKRGIGKYASSVDSTCWQAWNDTGDPIAFKMKDYDGVNRYVLFPVREKPEISDYEKLPIFVIDGNLEGVNLGTAGYAVQDAVLAKLVAKWGKPQTVVPRTLQNGFGAKYNTVTAMWTFENLFVRFQGVSTGIEQGNITIRTKKGKEWDEAQEQRPSRSEL